jgi:hypothetical protein
VTDDELTAELRELALLAAQMMDTCQRIIDACDERTAVRSWRDELGRDLEWLARWHSEIGR